MSRNERDDRGLSDSSRRFWAAAGALAVCWVLSRSFDFHGWVKVLAAFSVYTGLMVALPRLSSEKKEQERRISGQQAADEALMRAIEETRRKSIEFRTLAETVKDQALASELCRIADGVGQIMDMVKSDLSLVPQARSLMSYHVDKGLEVARTYSRLSIGGEETEGNARKTRLAAGQAVLFQMRQSVEAQLHAMQERDFRELEVSAESLARILREDTELSSSQRKET